MPVKIFPAVVFEIKHQHEEGCPFWDKTAKMDNIKVQATGLADTPIICCPLCKKEQEAKPLRFE